MDEKNYTGHCVQCKGKKIIVDPIPHKQPNPKSHNRHVNMVKGRCPDCKGIIYVVVGHG